ncbi:MAG: trypsin-like peptidase domain-containing protein [Planctomycetes bacterium]|nr:trypsin-like peptidase domain-containing protein [Planctomycetota bacterium]
MHRAHLLTSLTVCLLFPIGRATAQGGLVERSSSLLQVVEPDAGDRDLRLTPVVRAVQRAQDSVVSIYLQAPQALARGGQVTEGQGSGVILDDHGLVITNWHVVAPVLGDDSQRLMVSVKLRDGRQRPARVLSSSATRDLALLQLELEDQEKVQAAEIGRSADLMIGETVIAIGNPQGHANTVTSGVLSATGRSIQVRAPDGAVRSYADLLQTDAAINQGNSGGALLDITGRLVGINNAMAMGAENIGFAIPIDVVREAFEHELLQSQSFALAADAAWLGIAVGEGEQGVTVTRVEPDSPAAEAGLRDGDVLTGIDDQRVATPVDYLRRMVTARPNQPLPLRLRRAGSELRLAPVPVTRVDAITRTAIGAAFEAVAAADDPQLAERATRAFYRGKRVFGSVSLFPAVLRVASVRAGSPAEAIGLERGDVLLAVFAPGRLGLRELPVTTPTELARILEAQRGKGLRIAILRGDEDLVGTIDVLGPSAR